MKRLICVLLVLALMLTGCSGQNKTDKQTLQAKEELKKACDAYDKLTSFMWQGTYALKSDPEGNTYDFAMNKGLIVDYGNKNDSSDDRIFDYTEYGSMYEETWIQNGMQYTYDGSSLRTEPIDYEVRADLGLGELLRDISEAADKITEEKDGDSTIYHITLNEGILNAFVKMLEADANDQSMEKSDKDVMMVIDKDGNFEEVAANVYLSLDNEGYLVIFHFVLGSHNSATVPEFDPAEFAEDDDKKISFDYYDLDKLVWIEYDEEKPYALYKYEEDGEFDVFDDKYSIVYCTGYMYFKSSVEELIDKAYNGSAYKIVDERNTPDGKAVTVEVLDESDGFTEDSSLIFIVFDDMDLGIIIVGYEDSASLIKHFSEMQIYTTER